MNRTPRGSSRRGRRSLLFTVTPIVATVLIVVAMVAVIVHSLHKSAPAADPAAFGSTTLAGTPAPTTTHTTTADPPPPTSTTPADNPALAANAVKAVDSLQVSGVQYGAAILDRNTGKLTTGSEGTTGFFSASVVKLFVITDLLHKVEQGQVTLSSSDQAHIKLALERSDDQSMNTLWEKYDGPALVTQLISLAGLHDTVLDTSNLGEWGETKISARDVTAVWEYVLTKLSTADRDLVVNYTHSAADTGTDGFDQAFGLLQPPRPTTVKAKQGWMIAGSEMILNTTGVLGDHDQYVVAILTKQSASIGYPQGRANVDRASVLVLKQLSPGLG